MTSCLFLFQGHFQAQFVFFNPICFSPPNSQLPQQPAAPKKEMPSSSPSSQLWWSIGALVLWTVVGTGLLGLVPALPFQFYGYISYTPSWGGYCEWKPPPFNASDPAGNVGLTVLEPINAWTAIIYLVLGLWALVMALQYLLLKGWLDVGDCVLACFQVDRSNVLPYSNKDDLLAKVPSGVLDEQPASGAGSPPSKATTTTATETRGFASTLFLSHLRASTNADDDTLWSIRTAWLPSVVYFLVAFLLWYGSFWFHATFNSSSSYADFAGMLGIAAFTPSYAVVRFGAHFVESQAALSLNIRSLIWFAVFAVLYGIGFGLRAGLAQINQDPTMPIFVSYLFSGILLEIAYTIANVVRIAHYNNKKLQPAIPFAPYFYHFVWLLFIGVLFALAFILWTYDNDRNPIICMPTSFWQGHASWHALTAFGFFFLFVFYFAEPEVRADIVKASNAFNKPDGSASAGAKLAWFCKVLVVMLILTLFHIAATLFIFLCIATVIPVLVYFLVKKDYDFIEAIEGVVNSIDMAILS